jgi:hypothetical protein
MKSQNTNRKGNDRSFYLKKAQPIFEDNKYRAFSVIAGFFAVFGFVSYLSFSIIVKKNCF